MESIGSELKEIRESKGISLEEVYTKTKIHPNIIKSMEADNFQEIETIYAKGFLKIYTKFLGLNSEEYLQAFKKLSSKTEKKKKQEITPPAEKKEPKKIVISVYAKDIIRKIIVGIVILFIVVNFIKFVANRFRSRSQQPAQVSAPVEPAQEKTETPKKTKSAVMVKIAIKANQNSLLKVRLDGKLVYGDIFKKGMSESWEAKDKIELYVGNAGGIELEYNGKLLPSLGRRKEVLKNIVFTKDGFSINK